MAGFKLRFKNGINGSWQDWTPNNNVYVYELGAIKRQIESKVKGEAGLIGYDSVSIALRNDPGSVVNSVFSGDLSGVQRYIFEIYGIKSTGVEVKCFEGVADFLSITRPDNGRKIKFNIVDKLKALDILTTTNKQRGDMIALSTRVDENTDYVYAFSGRGSGGSYPGHDWGTFGNCGDEAILVSFQQDQEMYWGNPLHMTELCVKRGETIKDESGGLCFVRDAWLEQVPETLANSIGVYVYATWVRLAPADDNYKFFVVGITEPRIYLSTYYASEEEYIDVIGTQDANGRYPVAGFDALKIIELIIKNAWPDVTIINRTGATQYPIDLNYFTALIDEMPLDKQPYDCLKSLADSMRCYIFFDKLGRLVLQKRSTIGTSGTVRSLDQYSKASGEYKDFWEKLVDGVNVTVKSGITINDVPLVGYASVQKWPGIKPRNPINIEIIAPNTVALTQEALNTYALDIATEYLNWYGKRHGYYSISTALYDDMLDWELIDRIPINSVEYFFENLLLNLYSWNGSYGGVEIQAHDYDRQQVHIAMKKETYYSGGYAAGGGGSTVINQTITQSSGLPVFDFSFLNNGQSNIKIYDLPDTEMLEGFEVKIETPWLINTIGGFRLYDGSNNTLMTIDKIMGKMLTVSLSQVRLMKKYTANTSIYLELINGAQSATQGAGFIVVKKFKKESMQ